MQNQNELPVEQPKQKKQILIVDGEVTPKMAEKIAKMKEIHGDNLIVLTEVEAVKMGLIPKPSISEDIGSMARGFSRKISRLTMKIKNRIEPELSDIRREPKQQRNQPCACKSGKKYKHCCLNK